LVTFCIENQHYNADLLLLIMPALTMAMVAPFQLDITGKGFDIKKQLKLSDLIFYPYYP
jgi:hypothetical protein